MYLLIKLKQDPHNFNWKKHIKKLESKYLIKDWINEWFECEDFDIWWNDVKHLVYKLDLTSFLCVPNKLSEWITYVPDDFKKFILNLSEDEIKKAKLRLSLEK